MNTELQKVTDQVFLKSRIFFSSVMQIEECIRGEDEYFLENVLLPITIVEQPYSIDLVLITTSFVDDFEKVKRLLKVLADKIQNLIVDLGNDYVLPIQIKESDSKIEWIQDENLINFILKGFESMNLKYAGPGFDTVLRGVHSHNNIFVVDLKDKTHETGYDQFGRSIDAIVLGKM